MQRPSSSNQGRPQTRPNVHNPKKKPITPSVLPNPRPTKSKRTRI